MLELTAERLRELVRYNPETGVFTRPDGASAGSVNKATGYVELRVSGRKYYGHRLAWLYMTGAWPVQSIDHINGVRSQNRFANLRDIPHRQNIQNENKARISSTSGLAGVSWLERIHKWTASIHIDGKKKRIGSFSTKEEAHKAYLEYKRTVHPGFI